MNLKKKINFFQPIPQTKRSQNHHLSPHYPAHRSNPIDQKQQNKIETHLHHRQEKLEGSERRNAWQCWAESGQYGRRPWRQQGSAGLHAERPEPTPLGRDWSPRWKGKGDEESLEEKDEEAGTIVTKDLFICEYKKNGGKWTSRFPPFFKKKILSDCDLESGRQLFKMSRDMDYVLGFGFFLNYWFFVCGYDLVGKIWSHWI